MKKGLFIFIILFIGSLRVIALDVPSFVSQVPKCVEDKENTVLIPVNVLTYESGDLVSLIDNYSLGLIDRYDNYDIKIDNIEGNKIKNVLLSSLKSANRSYINYNIEDNSYQLPKSEGLEELSEKFSVRIIALKGDQSIETYDATNASP